MGLATVDQLASMVSSEMKHEIARQKFETDFKLWKYDHEEIQQCFLLRIGIQ